MNDDYFILILTQVLSALCTTSLWCLVGGIGFFAVPRSHSQDRLVLLGAGLLGAMLAVGGPVAWAFASNVLVDVVGPQNVFSVHALLNTGLGLLWLVPWALLLFGLFRVARGLATAVQEG